MANSQPPICPRSVERLGGGFLFLHEAGLHFPSSILHHPRILMLPDLIEIAPLTAIVSAGITVPGSKSITNRALILAALAEGETTLRGALWSEDTQVMVSALQTLGFNIAVAP